MKEAIDLVLLHPPGIFDFRECDTVLLPDFLNTLAAASPVYRIPPLGYYSMQSYLEGRGYRVRIVNLAGRMLRDPRFDVEKFLRTVNPRVFGIGLHWMVHAHGALELARLVKRVHPRTPVVFGGISASYYYAELIASPCIDFVVRGNMAAEPLRAVMEGVIRKDADFSPIPNLCYKKEGRTIVNPARPFGPRHLFPVRWDRQERRRDPEVVIFNPRAGCRKACCFCGGSNRTKRFTLQDGSILYKSKKAIRQETDSLLALRAAGAAGKRPMILSTHHGLEGGRLVLPLERLAKRGRFTEVYFELLDLPPRETVRTIAGKVPAVFSLTPYTHDERIRARCRCLSYRNDAMERWIETALRAGARRVELFFMTGLPDQTEASVYDTIDYCERLLKQHRDSRRVVPFIGAMTPFLDPGSPAFEDPGKFGYTVHYRTLEEHKAALLSPAFAKRLNYETNVLSRPQIVEVSFAAVRKLTRLKMRYGYMPRAAGDDLLRRMDAMRGTVKALEKIDAMKDGKKRLRALERLKPVIRRMNDETVRRCLAARTPLDGSYYRFWFEE